jgi:hypothetical protein
LGTIGPVVSAATNLAYQYSSCHSPVLTSQESETTSHLKDVRHFSDAEKVKPESLDICTQALTSLYTDPEQEVGKAWGRSFSFVGSWIINERKRGSSIEATVTSVGRPKC